MSTQTSAKLFAAAAIARNQELSSGDYELVIRQKPLTAKVFLGKEKDRKPIDPPPIIQLRISESVDPSQSFLQSPYYFISCSLLVDDETRPQAEKDEIRHALAGTLVSSLHRLKDTDNTDGGFFVFGDLSVKKEGVFRLQFSLYEFQDKEVAYIKSVSSGPFTVFASKNWPGMAESTFLTRSFSDQGVRLRLRKEPRFRLGARGPASDNYEPRRYKTQNRKQSETDLPSLPQLPQQAQKLYQQPQEAILSQRHTQFDYSGRMQQQGPMTWPSPISPVHSKKRDFSQSSQSGSYASYGDDTSSKRTRTDNDHTQQQSYGPQQYALSSDYGGRLYSDQNQIVGFASYPQQSPQQLYGSGYSSSPVAITPREQGGFSTPRRADTQFPSISSTYDSTSTRPLSMQSQRSGESGFSYATAFQAVPQVPFPVQPQQGQYVPQLTHPVPPREVGWGTVSYPLNAEPEQNASLPRLANRSSSDVLPPVFGSNTVVGMGMQHSGAAPLSSAPGGDDQRYSRNYMFDYKPRDDTSSR